MYRTHNCGELRTTNLDKEVELSGWVQKIRDKGFIMWVDLRDRYGITQLVFDQKRTNSDVIELAKTLGREFVINIRGTVIERASKNSLIDTGEVEVLVSELNVLNSSLTPPFTIENESDGGEELDCEMAFVSQEDILNTFENLVKHLFQKVKNIKLEKFPVMTYDDAIQKYGTDKPDLRYKMKFIELNDVAKNRDFNVFNNSELVVGFVINGGNIFKRNT